MLQIVQTRIISVMAWYHLAFFVISIAMFGLTAGSVWVYIKQDRFSKAHLGQRLEQAAMAFAITTALSLLVQMTLATGGSSRVMSVVVWGEIALCLAVPFFFSGIVVSLALTRSPYPIGWVYGCDLLGAAAGCFGILFLLEFTDGPSAVLWIAALAAVGSVLFASSGLGTTDKVLTEPFTRFLKYRRTIFFGLAAAALANGFSYEGIRPVIVKSKMESIRNLSYEEWNSYSRIRADKIREDNNPGLWGPSPKLPKNLKVKQRRMNIDGLAGTTMYGFDGDLASVDFLRYDLTNLAYHLPGLKRSAVIGVGGGRDMLSARVFGVESVTGVEINPVFVKLLTTNNPGFESFSPISRLPGTAFVVDEARSWFARATEKFDVIQMSLIDTWAATGAGAFTLSENGLYTIEAWNIFMDRLNERGVYTVSRWYDPSNINETGRMVSLATAVLLDRGVREPKRHLFLAAVGNIATLIVAQSPFSEDEIVVLREACKRLGFSILVDPDKTPVSAVLKMIVSARDRAVLDEFTSLTDIDLSPTTDNHPFFFNQLRMTDLRMLLRVATGTRFSGVVDGNIKATFTLISIVFISAFLVLAAIVLPLRPVIRNMGRRPAIFGTAYFVLIGIGFMMVEIGFLQRMSVFLGHPVYSLSIVLFSLILTAGIGSLVSERFQLNGSVRFVVWVIFTFAYLFGLSFWIPQQLLALDSASLAVRAAFTVIVIAPAGLLMGFGFPTGLRLVAAFDERPTPWFWGINGAAGVLAASIAVFVSIAYGINATIVLGSLCYLLLIPVGLGIGFRKIGSST